MPGPRMSAAYMLCRSFPGAPDSSGIHCRELPWSRVTKRLRGRRRVAGWPVKKEHGETKDQSRLGTKQRGTRDLPGVVILPGSECYFQCNRLLYIRYGAICFDWRIRTGQCG